MNFKLSFHATSEKPDAERRTVFPIVMMILKVRIFEDRCLHVKTLAHIALSIR